MDLQASSWLRSEVLLIQPNQEPVSGPFADALGTGDYGVLIIRGEAARFPDQEGNRLLRKPII
jgi:hypothetical protein